MFYKPQEAAACSSQLTSKTELEQDLDPIPQIQQTLLFKSIGTMDRNAARV